MLRGGGKIINKLKKKDKELSILFKLRIAMWESYRHTIKKKEGCLASGKWNNRVINK